MTAHESTVNAEKHLNPAKELLETLAARVSGAGRRRFQPGIFLSTACIMLMLIPCGMILFFVIFILIRNLLLGLLAFLLGAMMTGAVWLLLSFLTADCKRDKQRLADIRAAHYSFRIGCVTEKSGAGKYAFVYPADGADCQPMIPREAREAEPGDYVLLVTLPGDQTEYCVRVPQELAGFAASYPSVPTKIMHRRFRNGDPAVRDAKTLPDALVTYIYKSVRRANSGAIRNKNIFIILANAVSLAVYIPVLTASPETLDVLPLLLLDLFLRNLVTIPALYVITAIAGVPWLMLRDIRKRRFAYLTGSVTGKQIETDHTDFFNSPENARTRSVVSVNGLRSPALFPAEYAAAQNGAPYLVVISRSGKAQFSLALPPEFAGRGAEYEP